MSKASTLFWGENLQQDATIFLTDQVQGHPNIKDISKHIMFSVTDFYKNPDQANGYRKIFTDQHRLAEDSGGFQFLMGKMSDPDPLKTVEIYKRIGVRETDFPIQLDLPPRYNLGKEETEGLLRRGAEFYHIMAAEIPYVIPVVHGWTKKQLELSLELIDDPDKLASGTNIPPMCRSKDVMSAGTNLTGSGGSQYILNHITSKRSHVAAGANQQSGLFVLDHVGKLKKVAVGANQAMTTEKGWVMGHLNPRSSIIDRIATPLTTKIDWGYDPEKSHMKICSSRSRRIAAGAMNLTTPVVDNIISCRPRTERIAAGTFQVMGTGSGRNIYPRDQRVSAGTYMVTSVVASPAGNAEEIITTIDKTNRKEKAGIPKRHRAPQVIVLERLAIVLNMLRNRELFILGGASPHFQHMIFMGGAKYSDTSSWRLKAYMASIYLPEIGARSIGYKDTDTHLKKEEIPLLRMCLRNPTHPFNGMSVNDFLELGKMNVKQYYETVKEKKWPVKPFDLRALHNAWVLKFPEEETAKEYACDPDRYYQYLISQRFKGKPNLTRRCKKLWEMMKRPYVQTDLSIFLVT